VACLACDRDQARTVAGFTKSYFDEVDMLKGMVTRSTANTFELSNNVDVTVAPAIIIQWSLRAWVPVPISFSFYLDAKKAERRRVPRPLESPSRVQVFYTTCIPGAPISLPESSYDSEEPSPDREPRLRRRKSGKPDDVGW